MAKFECIAPCLLYPSLFFVIPHELCLLGEDRASVILVGTMKEAVQKDQKIRSGDVSDAITEVMREETPLPSDSRATCGCVNVISRKQASPNKAVGKKHASPASFDEQKRLPKRLGLKAPASVRVRRVRLLGLNPFIDGLLIEMLKRATRARLSHARLKPCPFRAR